MISRPGLAVSFALMTAVVVGCSSSSPPVTSSPVTSSPVTSSPVTQEEIEGIWILETFEVDGVEEGVEIGLNTSNQPWIEIGGILTGNLGCNDFGDVPEDGYTLTDGLLITAEVFRTAALCLFDGDPDAVDAMEVEEAFYGIFEEGIDGIRVEVDGDLMVWVAGNTKLTFSKAEAPPSG